MRVFSFAQESTRYCNYSKDKFNNTVTFIIPCWTNLTEGVYNEGHKLTELAISFMQERTPESRFIIRVASDEMHYFELLEMGWKPQEARAILCNALKTELVMTGFESDWEHFFFLRTAGAAHPQARELAIPLKEEFIKRNYIKQ